jgi:hypothetical protein
MCLKPLVETYITQFHHIMSSPNAKHNPRGPQAKNEKEKQLSPRRC